MFKQYIASMQGQEEILYIEDLWTEKWDAISITDDVSHLEDNDYFKILRDWLPQNGRILEGGCGTADWVRFFHQRGFKITGVEISKKTVNRIKQEYPQIDVRIGDIQTLDFSDGEFDVYLSFGVIEHFEGGPKNVLLEAHRVLKPGGLFFVSVPYINQEKQKIYLQNKITDNRREFPPGTPLRFYQYVMTKEELKRTVESMGFKALAFYPICAGHTLKNRSAFVKTIIYSTKKSNYFSQLTRPLLKKIWNKYVALKSRERFAHMLLGIFRSI